MGVVAAPITSGDTSFRSARLIIADFMKLDQKKVTNRIWISIPIFLAGFALTFVNFGIVWRYFAWSNQTLATVVLWTVVAFMIKEKKAYWIALVPALFMTIVVVSYILVAPEGFSLNLELSITAGVIVAVGALVATLYTAKNKRHARLVPFIKESNQLG